MADPQITQPQDTNADDGAVTGTGALVRATSPSLVTPNIGAATGLSVVLTASGIAATTTPVATLTNATATTSDVPEQRSPATKFSGSYWNTTASISASATLDLQFQTSGGGPVGALTATFNDTPGTGIRIDVPQTAPTIGATLDFPDPVLLTYDGGAGINRGDAGFGAQTLNFYTGGSGGQGFTFSANGYGFLAGVNPALEPMFGTETLGTATNGWSVLNLEPQTLAQLGSAATAGAGALGFCTDALVAPSGTVYATAVTGSGSFKAKVYSDGTNWLYG